MDIEFLTVDDVLFIHADQIERYGGSPDIRDLGLLDSAVAMPQGMFDGRYLHTSLFEMAAAYLFHIVQNHPFVDGNKRTGTAAAFVFLDLNGYELDVPEDALVYQVMAIAQGRADKPAVATFLMNYSRPSS